MYGLERRKHQPRARSSERAERAPLNGDDTPLLQGARSIHARRSAPQRSRPTADAEHPGKARPGPERSLGAGGRCSASRMCLTAGSAQRRVSSLMRITATHIRQAAAERIRKRRQPLEDVALQLADAWRARGRRETRRVVGAGCCACGPTRELMKRADLHIGAALCVHEHEVSPRRKTEVRAEREVDAALGVLGRRLQYVRRYARAAHAGPCLHKAQPPVAVHGQRHGHRLLGHRPSKYATSSRGRVRGLLGMP